MGTSVTLMPTPGYINEFEAPFDHTSRKNYLKALLNNYLFIIWLKYFPCFVLNTLSPNIGINF